MRFSEELAAEPERVDGTFPLPPPSHSTLPPVATTSPERLQHARSEPLGSLRDAREQETEARRRLYRLKRELTLAKSESALRAVHERKRASTPSPEADRLKPPVLVDVPRASAEAVREVAALLTVRMRQMGSESAGGERRHDSWFKLFKHMDDDGSGKVAYVEFEGLVRHELQLTPKELPEAALKAVWVALDSDGSGHISVGEFGAFMRKGGGATGHRGGAMMAVHTSRRREAAQAQRSELERSTARLARKQQDQSAVRARQIELQLLIPTVTLTTGSTRHPSPGRSPDCGPAPGAGAREADRRGGAPAREGDCGGAGQLSARPRTRRRAAHVARARGAA